MTLPFSTREAWAQSCMPKASSEIGDYATEAEITALKAAMVQRWRDLGSIHQGEDLRSKRICVRQALRRVERGKLPLFSEPTTEDLLTQIRRRYAEARTNVYNALAADDEAWSRELQRRDELEARYGHESNQGECSRHSALTCGNSEGPHGYRGSC